MRRSFLAHCLDCGASRQVRRIEIMRAARPKCFRCGGPLELSQAAQQNLAEIQSARREPPPVDARRKPTAEQPCRLIPRREAGRYEFHEFLTSYATLLRDPAKGDLHDALKERGPVAFYQRLTQEHALDFQREQSDGAFFRLQIDTIEGYYYECGQTYYKVWPAICDALQHTEMRVDGEFFALPHEAFAVRLPTRDNTLTPLGAALLARLPAGSYGDGREWTFGLLTVIPDRQGQPQYFSAALPVRRGLLLEDALDQAQLERETSIDTGLIRRLLRVCVGVCFFGQDRHETILPDLPRRIIEHYQGQRREPNAREATSALAEAKHCGLGGYKVGSEIELPRPVRLAPPAEGAAGTRGGLTEGYLRRGHMRLQAHGPEHSLRRLQFIPPTPVRPDLPMRATHGYKIRVPRT